jgi:hypothetical protein
MPGRAAAGRVARGVALVALFLAWPKGVAAQTVFCTPITAVPVTLTAQGRYCVTQPLRFDSTNGIAILIQSDYVTVDLGGYALDGTPGGTATTATGIYAANRRNLVVRGGTIRGFMFGIRVDDEVVSGYTAGGGHQIYDVSIDACTFRGILIQGRGVSVRGNRITRTGGSTFFSSVPVAAIDVRGPGARVEANTVVETRGVGSEPGWGVWLWGKGAVLEGNRISNETVAAPATVGILVSNDSHAVVTRNRLMNLEKGLAFDLAARGLARDNATSGCGAPFVLGAAVDGGRNQ